MIPIERGLYHGNGDGDDDDDYDNVGVETSPLPSDGGSSERFIKASLGSLRKPLTL